MDKDIQKSLKDTAVEEVANNSDELSDDEFDNVTGGLTLGIDGKPGRRGDLYSRSIFSGDAISGGTIPDWCKANPGSSKPEDN